MKPLVIGATLALGVATAATATSVAVQGPVVGEMQEQERPGPDSARVARFLATLRQTDPVACEMLSDQIGNFWWNGGWNGIGQFEDVRTVARAGKDSLSGAVRDPKALGLLAATLGDDDPCVRLVAAKMLGNSERSDDLIGRALGASSAREREAALRAAGERDRLAMRARVERMLGDEPAVAAMAAWTLGEWEQRASVPALRRVLTHASPKVRAAAANALGDIEDQSVAPDLERMITNDADRGVRLAAIEALGSLDLDESAAPDALLRAVESSDAMVKYAALEALLDFEDERLVPTFLSFITDRRADIRTRVIEQLGSIGATQAVAAITRALNDPDPDVRRAAVEALAEIDDR